MGYRLRMNIKNLHTKSSDILEEKNVSIASGIMNLGPSHTWKTHVLQKNHFSCISLFSKEKVNEAMNQVT
jgi:hypothetical protein